MNIFAKPRPVLWLSRHYNDACGADEGAGWASGGVGGHIQCAERGRHLVGVCSDGGAGVGRHIKGAERDPFHNPVEPDGEGQPPSRCPPSISEASSRSLSGSGEVASAPLALEHASPLSTTGIINRPSDGLLTRLFDLEDESSAKRIQEIQAQLSAREEAAAATALRLEALELALTLSRSKCKELEGQLSDKAAEIAQLGESLTTMQDIMKRRVCKYKASSDDLVRVNSRIADVEEEMAAGIKSLEKTMLELGSKVKWSNGDLLRVNTNAMLQQGKIASFKRQLADADDGLAESIKSRREVEVLRDQLKTAVDARMATMEELSLLRKDCKEALQEQSVITVICASLDQAASETARVLQHAHKIAAQNQVMVQGLIAEVPSGQKSLKPETKTILDENARASTAPGNFYRDSEDQSLSAKNQHMRVSSVVGALKAQLEDKDERLSAKDQQLLAIISAKESLALECKEATSRCSSLQSQIARLQRERDSLCSSYQQEARSPSRAEASLATPDVRKLRVAAGQLPEVAPSDSPLPPPTSVFASAAVSPTARTNGAHWRTPGACSAHKGEGAMSGRADDLAAKLERRRQWEHESMPATRDDIEGLTGPGDISANADSTEALRRLVHMHCSKGDVEALLEGLHLHRRQSAFAEEALRSLTTLAANRNTDQLPNIAGHGGIHRILGAMEANLKHSGVQTAGCSALKALAINAEMRASIASAGGIRTICEALENHPRDDLVLEQAMGALSTVCSSEKAVQRRVREELGVERLQKAVSHLPAGLTKDWGDHLVDMIQAS
jgi:hypothetical protein